MLDRRHFFAASAAGLAVTDMNAQDPPKPGPIADDLVRKFVGSSHGNLKAVQEMLAEQPALVNATWDWGDGDFETGLGAASHVGSRPVAEFLLEKGARIDVFAATMLAYEKVVSAFLEVEPKVHASPGPHGIPLLAHAFYGGETADGIAEMLVAKGADVNGAANSGMTLLMMAAGIGRVGPIKLLLENGADPKATDKQGRTALQIAEKAEKEEAVKLLREALAG